MALRIAYVTSGMGHTGTAICQALHRAGHRVVAGCGPRSSRKQQWLKEQKALGYAFSASEGDATDWASTEAAFAQVRREVGEIDVLVNNAGAMLDMRFRQMEYADWSAVLRSNLDTLFNTTKQVVDRMADRGWGRIINIGSVAAEKGQIGQINYATAKGAVIGFSRSLAQEVASRGVTVNVVSPGFIADEKVQAFPPAMLDRLVETVPVGRLGTAQDLANLCTWLASDEAAFVTGANYAVNGGVYMG
ncbi:3-ketoacyl-(acyl-carrier-protein) reductase [Bordetella ansorpii]|uniref:3-ketoacyl-(Acyl-carrier-protein) reductase n=1 Tax=Bordetella ansorpii TaxID=288768 RepID=A0A157NJ40_9BORD|nr:SDR family oxidoreductase [Bordetella ansorpii]SAI21110.1 3-ketoacyl-(acyl-carrier-protein) reductase [Bordetella ansorpii]